MSYERFGLLLTCVLVGALAAFVTWLLAVESDDDYPAQTPDEPEWWPAFAREFEAWSADRRRVSSGTH